uniref:Ig-like domain-containing protein n=1 Tax=Paramormyrops kingsleyae TaxID=1676925 RepID=A0A3B3Q6B2_9TELE
MSLLVVAGLLWTSWPWLCLGSSEIHVTCVFSEVCVLPCQFTKGRDELIHWDKGTARVHSFYYNMDQLGQQDPAYKNRTSMDKEQVAEGNASLSLQRTNLQDGGTYKCYCSTAQGRQEYFVMVEVKAPVRTVDMKVLDEEVHCSSQNIYPKPHVSWATDPPTSSEALQATTESLPDSVGLFALESWVGILGNRSDYTYICSISLEGASQLWTASLKHQGTTASTFQSGTVVCSAVFVTSVFAGFHVTDIIEGVEGQALSIPCHAPNDLQNFTLTWAFMTTGQPTVFLSFSSQTGKVANNWADRVQLDTI